MTKYKVDDNSYNYDDFHKQAEQGLDDFLGGIKRGNIRRKEFVQAYNELMSGIKDGTIIFQQGGLKDTQGRYKNKDSKLKDYYGIMAYYLNDIHNNMSPIPESTDNATQQTQSEESQEATLSESSEEQSQEQQEVKSVETTKSKGQQFKEYFDQTYQPFTGELPSSFQFQATSFQATDSEFKEWKNRWTEVYNAYLTKSTDALIKSLSNIMANNDKAKKDLNILSQNFNPIVADSFKMGDFAHLILKALQEKGALKESDGKLYIEGLSFENTPSVGFIYDKSKQEITPTHYADIDYIRRDAYNKFASTQNNQNTNPWDSYYATYSGQTASHKNGGVMKMQTGDKFNTPLEAIVYTDEDLQKRYQNVFNDGVFTQQLRESNATDNIATGNNQYDIEQGGAELEQQQYYQDFLNLLLNNEKLAKAWATDYKNRQNVASDVYADWFDDKGNFQYDKFKENIARVNQDSKNGVGHDIYKGRAFKIKDQEGYYNTIPTGYALIEGEVDESNPLVNVYTLQQIQNPTVGTDNNATSEGATQTQQTDAQTDQSDDSEEDDTIIDARKPKEKASSKTPSFGIPSTLPGITRMLTSMKANKDIENTLLQGLQAHLQNTYSLHHPVFGDLGARQFYVQQGIDNALRLGSSPTSDARTNYNAAIKGIEGINQMNEKGFLADNTEIKRTQAENLKREEDNAARKTATANANLKELINLAQTKSQIQASRKQKDWASIDELLKSIESDAKTNVERGRQFYIASETSDIDKEYTEIYQQQYQKLKQQADEKYNGDITKSPDYDKFIQFKSKLTEWRKAKYLNAQARAYGMGVKDGTKGKSAKDYVKDSLLFKRGGSLNHVVMNLINRTMKCE